MIKPAPDEDLHAIAACLQGEMTIADVRGFGVVVLTHSWPGRPDRVLRLLVEDVTPGAAQVDAGAGPPR
jgi:hypothetical protein